MDGNQPISMGPTNPKFQKKKGGGRQPWNAAENRKSAEASVPLAAHLLVFGIVA